MAKILCLIYALNYMLCFVCFLGNDKRFELVLYSTDKG